MSDTSINLKTLQRHHYQLADAVAQLGTQQDDQMTLMPNAKCTGIGNTELKYSFLK